MPPSTPAGPYLVSPNSSGVVSLGDLPDQQQYLAARSTNGQIVLKPVNKTPFVGEGSEDAPTSGSVGSS